MKKLRVHAILAAITLVIGLLLMAYMIYAESEPGLLPLLLVGLGIGWYFVTRARIRSHPE